MAANKPPIVLVTGANGFIGYKIVVEALRANYHVLAAVRRQDAIDSIRTGASVQKYLNGEALTFHIIPDMTLPHAFDEAAKGCSYIIHVAAALATQPGRLVALAVASTKAILKAAEGTPTIKRVVFTAAGISIIPWARFLPNDPSNLAIEAGNADDVPNIMSNSQVDDIPLLPEGAPRFHEYGASKVATTNLVREYALSNDSKSAHFSIIHLMPTYVLGPEELTYSKKDAFQGSNFILSWLFTDMKLNPLFGVDEEQEMGLIAGLVHLDDTVEGHIKALNLVKVPGKYRAFLMAAEQPRGPVIESARQIVKERLPEEAKRIPFTGHLGQSLTPRHSNMQRD